MSEAYLFAASKAAAPDAALQDLLRKAGARPAWLAEVHWLGAPLPAAPEGWPFFAWPDYPLLPFFVLQSALRGLQSGAFDLVALGQSAGENAAALLLGSPAAVGRWNVPPLARLSPLSVQSTTPAAFLAEALRAASAFLPEDARLSLACLGGLPEVDPHSLPEGLALLLADEPALARVAHLSAELAATQQDFALLAGAGERGGLAFLVERV